MDKNLAYDGINGEHETFAAIEEAQSYLMEVTEEDGEIHPDLMWCAIYELKQKLSYDVTDRKDNYKYECEEDIPDVDTDSEAWPYGSEYNEIWTRKFVDVNQPDSHTFTVGTDLYYDLCIDTFLSGDLAHCEELFNDLTPLCRKDLIRYIDRVELPLVKEFYFNLL